MLFMSLSTQYQTKCKHADITGTVFTHVISKQRVRDKTHDYIVYVYKHSLLQCVEPTAETVDWQYVCLLAVSKPQCSRCQQNSYQLTYRSSQQISRTYPCACYN